MKLTIKEGERLWAAHSNGQFEYVYDQIVEHRLIEDIPRLLSSKESAVRHGGVSLGMLVLNVSLDLKRTVLLDQMVGMIENCPESDEYWDLLNYVWRVTESYLSGKNFEETELSTEIDLKSIQEQVNRIKLSFV